MEILLLGITAVSIVVFKRVESKVLRGLTGGLLLIATALHFIGGGYRWQMIPCYLCLLLILRTLLPNPPQKKRRRTLLIRMILLLISSLLIVVFPYRSVKAPEGPYSVGTRSFDIVDSAREEIYGERAGEKRKIRVQLWYPTETTRGFEKENWLSDGKEVARMIPAFVGLPGFLLEYAARFSTESYLKAPIRESSAPFPVIILSHGWLGFRNLHTDIGEMLASEGFLVLGIDHTYGCLATVFDNGQVARIDPEALPDLPSDEFAFYANRLVKTYSLDTQLALETLEALNEGDAVGTTLDLPDFLYHKINMEAVGLLGHSTGGGGVTRLAMINDQIQAVVGLDPWVEPVEREILERGMHTPSLFLRSEQWSDRPNNAYLGLIQDQPGTVTEMYQIAGISHQDFTMMYMLEPVSRIAGFTGELDSTRSNAIQKDFILNFFNLNLRDSGVASEEVAARYPEVSILTDLSTAWPLE